MQMIAVSDALDTPWAGGDNNRLSLFSTGRRRTSSDLLSGGSSSNESNGFGVSQTAMPVVPNTHLSRMRQSLTGHQGMPRVNSLQRIHTGLVPHHTGHTGTAGVGGGGADTQQHDIESTGALGQISYRMQVLEHRVTNVEKRIGFFSADDNILEGNGGGEPHDKKS
jgi:hypothetical protein